MSDQWYIRSGGAGRVQGPFSRDRIQRYIDEGRLKSHFEVSTDAVAWAPPAAYGLLPPDDAPETFQTLVDDSGQLAQLAQVYERQKDNNARRREIALPQALDRHAHSPADDAEQLPILPPAPVPVEFSAARPIQSTLPFILGTLARRGADAGKCLVAQQRARLATSVGKVVNRANVRIAAARTAWSPKARRSVAGVAVGLAALLLLWCNVPSTRTDGKVPVDTPREVVRLRVQTVEPVRTVELVLPSDNGTDTKKYVLYALAGQSYRLPQSTDASDLERELVRWRRDCLRYREYCRVKNLGTDFVQIADGAIAKIDLYTKFLSAVGLISSEAVARREREMSETAFGAGYNAGQVGRRISDQGGNAADAMAGAAIVGILQYLVQEGENARRREFEYNERVTAARRQFLEQYQVVRLGLQDKCREIWRLRGWAADEVAFDVSVSEEFAIKDLIAKGEFASVRDIFHHQVRRKPRDPCAASNYMIAFLLARQFNKRQTFSEVFDLGVATLGLIPSTPEFASDRADHLGLIGDIANERCGSEIDGGRWANGPAPSAGSAVGVWEKYLEYDSLDVTGRGRYGLAVACAYAGNLARAASLMGTVQPLHQNDSAFLYDCACAFSLSTDYDHADQALRAAVEAGFANVQLASHDPNLTGLRATKPVEFSATVSCRYVWSVGFGVFNDDIVIVNQSKFAFTNLVLVPRIVQGGRVWEPRLELPHLAAGATHKWLNAVSIPGSKYDSASATLTCDQNR